MTPRFDERVPIALAFAASAILHAGALVMPRWQHAHVPEPPAPPLMVELVHPAQPVPVAPPEPAAPTTERAAARPAREPAPKPMPRSTPQTLPREARPAPEPPPLAMRAPAPVAPVLPAPAEPAVPAQGTPEPVPAPTAAGVPAASVPGVAEAGPRTMPPSYGAAYLRNPAPRYPAEARRGGAEGTVMLRVWVNAEGVATRVEIDRTSGHRALDDAAVAAVKNWRFVPAQRAGQAVEGLVTVPLVFRLDASS